MLDRYIDTVIRCIYINMNKQYLQLTEEQKKRGVVFSSQLMPGTVIHEVLASDTDKQKIISRLLTDSFFDNSPYQYNKIRQ